jgi:hypothetical protein
MLTALVLASLTQFSVVLEQSETVVYELPVMQTTMYQTYSLVPVVRSASMVVAPRQGAWIETLPSVYYLRSEPLMPLFYFPMGAGRTVIKERWPGFRSRTIMRY